MRKLIPILVVLAMLAMSSVVLPRGTPIEKQAATVVVAVQSVMAADISAESKLSATVDKRSAATTNTYAGRDKLAPTIVLLA